MSNKIKTKKPGRKQEEPPKSFLRKYSSFICIAIGATIGLVYWFFFVRCTNIDCPDHFYPIPIMGIFGFFAWIISVLCFKRG